MGFFKKFFKVEKTVVQPDKQAITFTEKVTQTKNSNIPAFQGDYAMAVFLHVYSKASPIKENSEYQQYLLYECGIRDAQAYHKGLVSREYLTPATLEEKLHFLKISDLKSMLKEMHETSSGKKEELIKKIINNNNEEIIKKYFNKELYSISEKGNNFLEEHSDYIKIHNHTNWNINWKEYDNRKKPGYSFYDVVWGMFNERVFSSDTFGRNEYYMMFELLLEEGKRKRACEMLLKVLYLDLNGIEFKNDIQLYKSNIYSKNELYENLCHSFTFAPGVVYAITQFKDVYDESMIDNIYKQRLSIQLCSKELFREIVVSILKDTFDEEIYTQKLKKECKDFIKML